MIYISLSLYQSGNLKLEKDHSMMKTDCLKNVIFQTILSFLKMFESS